MTSVTAQPVAEQTRPHPPLTGARRAADIAYAVLQSLFAAAVLAQVFLAGVGAFAHRTAGEHPFAAHEDLGNALGVAGVVLLAIALIARVGWATVVAAIVLAVLTEVAQHGLAQGGRHHAWLGGLHALDGMIILLVGTWLSVAACRRVFARPAAP